MVVTSDGVYWRMDHSQSNQSNSFTSTCWIGQSCTVFSQRKCSAETHCGVEPILSYGAMELNPRKDNGQ